MHLHKIGIAIIAVALFTVSSNAQVIRPVANPYQQVASPYQQQVQQGQQAQAQVQPQAQAQAPAGAAVNLSDNGAGCGGCDTGCQSACGQGCGARPRMMGRLRNALPSIQFSGNNSGCGCAYRSIFGGWSDMDDLNTPAGAAPSNGTFNDGFLLGTASGRYLNNNTRVEMESSWRANSGDTYNGQPLDGHFNNYSTMVNIIRDLPSNGPVNFYAGIGGGISRQDGDFTSGGNSVVFDDWAAAYQAMAGVNFKRNANTDFFAEYRYFGNAETQVEFNGADAGEFDYVSEGIIFGLRFKR